MPLIKSNNLAKLKSISDLFLNNKNINLFKLNSKANIRITYNYTPKSLLYYKTVISNPLNTKINVLSKKILSNVNTYSTDHGSSSTRIVSVELARQFIDTLTPEERNIIKEQIIEVEKQHEVAVDTQTPAQVVRPAWSQLSMVCLQTGLPFIGFGFVDNFLMIIAGDFIESWIGMMIPISTMAAAGLGNAVSDVAGIGLAHHIESFAFRLVKIPKLTSEQWNLRIVTWLVILSKSLSIFLGCVIGMCPLLFMDKDDKEEKRKETKDATNTTITTK